MVRNPEPSNVYSTIPPRPTEEIVKRDLEPKPGKDGDGTRSKRQHSCYSNKSSMRSAAEIKTNGHWNERRRKQTETITESPERERNRKNTKANDAEEDRRCI